MKKAIIDSSSAILLFKSGLYNDLVNTYEIIMTESVFHELTSGNYPGAEDFINYKLNNKIIIRKSKNNINLRSHSAILKLHIGEADTILQFLNGAADFIIIDDGKGAAYCRNNKILYINALLFPKILFLKNSITEDTYFNKTSKIISLGRYSREIIEYAECCVYDDLECFIP